MNKTLELKIKTLEELLENGYRHEKQRERNSLKSGINKNLSKSVLNRQETGMNSILYTENSQFEDFRNFLNKDILGYPQICKARSPELEKSKVEINFSSKIEAN